MTSWMDNIQNNKLNLTDDEREKENVEKLIKLLTFND
jgi:hypothetical protein